MQDDIIYFDNSATTPLDPRVADAMRSFLGSSFGNPSSLHCVGREARRAVEEARVRVAALLNASPEDIVSTASGTESDNLALIGVIDALGWRDCDVVTSRIEHPAVLQTCRYLETRGVTVTYLPVDAEGLVAPESLAQAMKPTTRLVSIMAANNVVGTLQPIAQLAQIAHSHGALFHTDAVQAAGKIPLDAVRQGFDLLSISAHKLNGPKGVGALYVGPGVSVNPIVYGGGQERGLRSATENVAGIVGLGVAAEIARQEMAEETARTVNLRDHLLEGVMARFPFAYLIGHRYRRLPGHLCLGFGGFEGEAIKLLLALDAAGICISSGSACGANHAGEPSHILTAMGFDAVRARGSLRITLGRFNNAQEVERFLEVLPHVLAGMKPMALGVQGVLAADTHLP